MAVEEGGRWSLDPSKVVEREAGKWKQLWLPEGSERWAPRSPVGPTLAPLDRVELRSIARGLRQESGGWGGRLEVDGAQGAAGGLL